MAYDFGQFKEDALTKPRDKAWENWAKFEAVGSMVQGFIRDVFFRASEGQFAEQRGLTLEQADGTLVNVGIKHIDFVLAKTDRLRLNDPVTIVFEKEIPPSVKGYSPTKQFAFYGKNLPENASQKTVAELEAEDRASKMREKEEADKGLAADVAAAAKTPVTPAATPAAAAATPAANLPFEKPAAPVAPAAPETPATPAA